MAHVDFVHLHSHTQYSLLDGASQIPDLIKRAVELKFPALAMTDHGNMFGTISFYNEAMKQGIKPIIGMESYIAPRSRFDKGASGIKEASYHLTLLCRNETGYKNLMKLTTASYLEGFYYRPRIDKEILKQYSDGLIGLSGCLKGEIASLLLDDRIDDAKQAIREYMDIFGRENFYLEIMDHNLEGQKKIRTLFPGIAKECGVKLVATNDCHYIYKSDASAHDALICIGTGAMISDQNRIRYDGSEYYLKSADEMKKIFKDFPDAIKHSIEIAEKCNLELDFSKTYLPVFTPPAGQPQPAYLEELCLESLKKIFTGKNPSHYHERLRYELSVINKMGFTSYFLIVWDFIRYAKEHGIPVGPGRGSAAGSLVAYALGITTIDPIVHNLIFERFLNPDRISMPDIDIDFCYERRDEVIRYVQERYGTESVAQIITFGTMAARAVIRDVGRVMGMSYQEVDKLAKMIPVELEMTIEKALKVEPKLNEMIKADERVRQLFETSKSLEGITRHASTHAAGVVISDGPLSNYCPLCKSDEQIITQYDMKAVEKIGLLKMDFLGLKTLTVIDETVNIIRETKQKDFQIDAISLDDKVTYSMLEHGEAIGIFQLESSGMRDLLRKMKPTHFEEIVALLALYRPGPLGSGMVDDFIKRMHNPSLIKYDHPALEPILKETYGIILYQEQVMQIVSVLAGFSLAKADSLRRAMGKKISEIMEKEKQSFIEGAGKKHVPIATAEKIWNLIEYFSGYGFNKSHSTAYAFISYQTAYLKANYPVEFMTAILTSENDNTDKIVRYIEECRRLGILVVPPSVNKSHSKFTCFAKDRIIHFGLNAVKNVGTTAVDSIVKAREASGVFKSIYDFTERVDLRVCNRKVLESMIKSGAFDEFGLKRSQLMALVDRVLETGAQSQRDRQRGQFSLLDQMDDQSGTFQLEQVPENIDEWPESQLLAYEREILGFYVSAHPLTKFENILKIYSNSSTQTLAEAKVQETVSIGGIISTLKEITTKRGDRMAFVELEDLNGKCEVVVFPELYKSSYELLKKDSIVFVRGKVNAREETPKIIADEIIPLEDVEKKMTRMISIDLLTAGLEVKILDDIKHILKQYPGTIPVHLNFKEPSGRRISLHSGDKYKVDTNPQLFQKLEDLLGVNAVTVKT